ncbi:MAG: hypothetical protein R2932_14515 [Caldilineaceae bacterium]
MTARDEILANLRHALADPGLRFPPTAPEPLTAATRLTVTQATGTKAELAARFGAELVQLHGSFQVVGSVPESAWP